MIALFKRLLGIQELPDRLSYEGARAVLESHHRQLESELASRTDAEPEMLYYLAERGDARSRRAVAANPSAPSHANRLLAGDADSDVRGELARKIGRLLPALLKSEREKVCRQTLETLQKLADDQLAHVRAILAEEIKHLDCVPPRIVQKLARDAEAAVSAPILEYSPLLSDSDLVEIITSVRAKEALTAIARRRGLSEEVTDAIAATLDTQAVAVLLANPDARFREKTLEELVERAETIVAWQGPLVSRTDLSLRVLRRIAGFVGAALLEELTTRHDLDEETKTHLNRCLRARLEKDEFQSAQRESKAQKAVERAQAAGALNEGFVESAVELGDRELVIEALAALARAQRPRVERIFASRSAKAVTALAWRACLPMRIAFKIQALLLKLKADELLPARAGVAYPLSEDDMLWHLSLFGLTDNKSRPA